MNTKRSSFWMWKTTTCKMLELSRFSPNSMQTTKRPNLRRLRAIKMMWSSSPYPKKNSMTAKETNPRNRKYSPTPPQLTCPGSYHRSTCHPTTPKASTSSPTKSSCWSRSSSKRQINTSISTWPTFRIRWHISARLCKGFWKSMYIKLSFFRSLKLIRGSSSWITTNRNCAFTRRILKIPSQKWCHTLRLPMLQRRFTTKCKKGSFKKDGHSNLPSNANSETINYTLLHSTKETFGSTFLTGSRPKTK